MSLAVTSTLLDRTHPHPHTLRLVRPAAAEGSLPVVPVHQSPLTDFLPANIIVPSADRITGFNEILESGNSRWRKFSSDGTCAQRTMLQTANSALELITVKPIDCTYEKYLSADKPVIWLFHGWWGNAEQNLAFGLEMAKQGYMVRLFSLGDHGRSKPLDSNRPGGLPSYPADIQDLLKLFGSENKALVTHSAATKWTLDALNGLFLAPPSGKTRKALDSIVNLIPLGAVSSRGPLMATFRYLSGATRLPLADSLGYLLRFTGQLKFWGKKTGLNYVVDANSPARQILFNDRFTDSFIARYRERLDIAHYLEYLKLTLGLLVAPYSLQAPVASGRRLVIHLAGDGNSSQHEQEQLARRLGARLAVLPDLPHQCLATPEGVKAVAQLIQEELARKA